MNFSVTQARCQTKADLAVSPIEVVNFSSLFIPVNCPVGTFFNILSRDCVPCGLGSYQPREGQETCLVIIL